MSCEIAEHASKDCMQVREILNEYGIDWNKGVIPEFSTDFLSRPALARQTPTSCATMTESPYVSGCRSPRNSCMRQSRTDSQSKERSSHEKVKDDRGPEAFAGARQHHEP